MCRLRDGSLRYRSASGQRGKDPNNMRRKPLALVACAVLAATAFTACGDDDDDDEAPTDTGGGVSVPAATVTEDTTMTTTS